MTTLGWIAIVCVALVFGSVAGGLLVCMNFSNERYDTSEAVYDYAFDAGYTKRAEEDAKNMNELCSHCGKRN